MIRSILATGATFLATTLFWTGYCSGQSATNALASLEQSATKTHADWLRLATDLEVRVARVLPCDPVASATIEETTRASSARIVALTAYLNAATEQAVRDTGAARQIQQTQRGLLAASGQERSDTELERAGIESQINNLAESVKKKPSLGPAEDQLKALEALVKERAATVSRTADAEQNALALYDQLVLAMERREKTLRQQVSLLEEERTKWNGYYTARLARARIECSVTGGR
ncbi:MAG: hypothetical protein ABI811_05055 [Acidobacteriota bacterium]